MEVRGLRGLCVAEAMLDAEARDALLRELSAERRAFGVPPWPADTEAARAERRRVLVGAGCR